MSNKKVRAGHWVFLEKVIAEAGAFLEEDRFAAVTKTELLKWKASLKEQSDKTAPLDEHILAELTADEKATEPIVRPGSKLMLCWKYPT